MKKISQVLSNSLGQETQSYPGFFQENREIFFYPEYETLKGKFLRSCDTVAAFQQLKPEEAVPKCHCEERSDEAMT